MFLPLIFKRRNRDTYYQGKGAENKGFFSSTIPLSLHSNLSILCSITHQYRFREFAPVMHNEVIYKELLEIRHRLEEIDKKLAARVGTVFIPESKLFSLPNHLRTTY